MSFQIALEIDDSWIEPVYEHVHHGRSLSLLEQGRIELLKSIGTPNDALLARGLALVIVRIEVAYKREIVKGPVTVSCIAGALRERSIVLTQQVRNSRGKVAIDATVESMFMSSETRRGLEIPDEFRARFESWVAGDPTRRILSSEE
jgi:YbgC/YbaW family acyl-CoA thioester hydrolase